MYLCFTALHTIFTISHAYKRENRRFSSYSIYSLDLRFLEIFSRLMLFRPVFMVTNHLDIGDLPKIQFFHFLRFLPDLPGFFRISAKSIKSSKIGQSKGRTLEVGKKRKSPVLLAWLFLVFEKNPPKSGENPGKSGKFFLALVAPRKNQNRRNWTILMIFVEIPFYPFLPFSVTNH